MTGLEEGAGRNRCADNNTMKCIAAASVSSKNSKVRGSSVATSDAAGHTAARVCDSIF